MRSGLRAQALAQTLPCWIIGFTSKPGRVQSIEDEGKKKKTEIQPKQPKLRNRKEGK
ncbi:hypothetical protein COLO4_22145 [Corchorus olitorius]|uniref:Uncharacterized protein n=1 Tax=Corchorus olitorius TaxID=93759 RepID=A0A1R3INU4_9ROSI|nr:hypothetical protein COLO4_22145 [Corchorus olitorius]